MVKVNLKAIPYCLSDEDIAWVEKTIAGMTDEEKVGQLFFENRGQSADEARKTISGLIVDEIARVLRLPREDVARTQPLSEIGLDSLMAVELALGLEERFVLNSPLTATASSFSVNELADHIIGLATGSLSDDEAITRQMIQRHLGAEALHELSTSPEELQETADLVRARSQTLKGLLT